MPIAADRAWTAISARSRLEVLQALNCHGPSAVAELSELTGLTKQTVHSAIQALEPLGYIETSLPEGERRGHTVLYRAASQRLNADITAFITYLGVTPQ